MMSLASYAPLVTLPTLIDKPGQYQTRAGELVTIERVSTRHDFECLGLYSNGIPEGWHKSGRLYFHAECKNDIIGRAA